MNKRTEGNSGLAPTVYPEDAPALWKLFRRGDLWAIFLTALFLRLVMFAANNNQVGTQTMLDGCFDCRLYLHMADAMVAGTPEAYANGFFYFGPGFACFLAGLVVFFKSHIFPLIVVNIVLSSSSCLLIYALARHLTGSYAIAVVAALLAATSYTSIALACYIMSDTLYFFVFLLGLLAYLRALASGRWLLYVAAGVLTGAAVMIRSVGQFWPVMMIGMGLVHWWRSKKNPAFPPLRPGALTLRVFVAVAIPILLMLGWMSHNYRVNGVFTMGITSANGPANIAAITIERRTGVPAPTTMNGWVKEYLDSVGKTEVPLGETYRVYLTRARAVVDSLRWAVYKTYLSVMWENLNEICLLHRQLVPEYDAVTILLEEYIRGHYLNYANFILSMTGLTLLLWRRRWWVAVVLGGIYVYYAALGGFFRWQYTRHFMPGQIAWAILIAIVLVTIARLVGRLGRWVIARLRPIHQPPG